MTTPPPPNQNNAPADMTIDASGEAAPRDSGGLLINPRIINTHEHLMAASLFDKYQQAARAVGIVSTVLVGSPRYPLRATP